MGVEKVPNFYLLRPALPAKAGFPRSSEYITRLPVNLVCAFPGTFSGFSHPSRRDVRRGRDICRAIAFVRGSIALRHHAPPGRSRNQHMADIFTPSFVLARRALFSGGGRMMLSATAIALLSGNEALASSVEQTADASSTSDVDILNTALGAEQEAIAAYQVGAESGLLKKPALDLAVTFQGHHKAHAALLASTVKKLGGTPSQAKTVADYHFPTSKLKTGTDVLRFAAGLEKGAVSAYLGAIPLFANRDLAKAAGSILGDEAMHWAVLRQALGDAPVPEAFVS
jgi:rubrerythrin